MATSKRIAKKAGKQLRTDTKKSERQVAGSDLAQAKKKKKKKEKTAPKRKRSKRGR